MNRALPDKDEAAFSLGGSDHGAHGTFHVQSGSISRLWAVCPPPIRAAMVSAGTPASGGCFASCERPVSHLRVI